MLSEKGSTALESASPVLPLRLLLASTATPMKARPPSIPNYLTDLGVRRSDEPRMFFDAAQRAVGQAPLLEDADTDLANFARRWSNGELTEPMAIWWLDANVSIAGFWRTAAVIANHLDESPRRPCTARLRTYIGSALANEAPAEAERWFLLVSSAVDVTPDVAAAAAIRIAAIHIKRKGSMRRGLSALGELSRQLEVWERDGLMSPGDRHAMLAVAGNLRSLAETMAGDLQAATTTLARASVHAEAGQLVSVDPDQRGRYASQIGLNQVQLTARIHGWNRAAADAVDHLERTRARHPGSVSEAVSFAAYSAYRAGDFDTAARLARDAEQATALEGAPLRLASARKILIAALSALERQPELHAAVDRLATDPLGTSCIAERTARDCTRT